MESIHSRVRPVPLGKHEFSNGIVGLHYRRHRQVAAFPVPGGAVVLRSCEIL